MKTVYAVVLAVLTCAFIAGTAVAAEYSLTAEMRLEKGTFRPDEPINVNVIVKNNGDEYIPWYFRDGNYVGPRIDYGSYLFQLEPRVEMGSNHGPLTVDHVYLGQVPSHSEIRLLRFDAKNFFGPGMIFSPGEHVMFIVLNWKMEDDTYKRLYAEAYFTIADYNNTDTVLNAVNALDQKVLSVRNAVLVIRNQVAGIQHLVSTVYALEQKVYIFVQRIYSVVISKK